MRHIDGINDVNLALEPFLRGTLAVQMVQMVRKMAKEVSERLQLCAT